MSLRNVLQGVFYFPTKNRLEDAYVSIDPLPTLFQRQRVYLVITDENHDRSVGGHFFHGIKVSNGVNGDKGAVPSLARALSPGSDPLTTACQLAQSLFPPRSHKIIVFIIFGRVRTRTVTFLLRRVDFLVVDEIAGEGIDCLSEASFLSRLKGASISYDSFWSSICVELYGGGKIRSCHWRFGRGVGDQCLLVLVAGIQNGALAV